MDILCLGLMVCDILVKPVTAGVLKRDSTRMDYIGMASGGDAFNVAVNLARMGVSAGVCGKVGDDGFGRYLLERTESAGVDTSHVIVSKECGTSACVVMIGPDAERSFAYYGGANDSLRLADLRPDSLTGIQALAVGSAFSLPGLDNSLTELFRYARGLGVITALDVTNNPGAAEYERLKGALPYVDYFMPSLDEARSLSGQDDTRKAAELFLAAGAAHVVIKAGESGSYLAAGGEFAHVPAFNIQAVDTTGAGDAFVAGFLAATLRGLPLRDRMRVANAAGALCATRMGATTAACPYHEILAWMNSQATQRRVETKNQEGTVEP